MAETNDSRQNFIFENLPIRGSIVRLDAILAKAFNTHQYPQVLKPALAQALASVALLGNIGKQTGRLSLQFQGRGALTLLTAQSTSEGYIRGLAQFDKTIEQEGLQKSLRQGQLGVIYQPDQSTQNYQSIVAIEGDNLIEALEHYFKQSEQILTKVIMLSAGQDLFAIMLQALPDQGEGKQQEAFEYACALAETLTQEEVATVNNANLLHRLFHQDEVRLFDVQPLEYGCKERAKRFENAVLTLGKAEAEKLLEEHSNISVTCEFCGKEFVFDRIDVESLFNANAPQGDGGGKATRH